MPSETLVSVRDARERAIAQLTEHFADDRLEIDEFERRVNLVHRAPSVAEVEKILADLSSLPAAPAPAQVPAVRPQTALVPATDVRESQSFVAFFGGVVRKGTWTAARYTRISCVFGGAELDFRDARLPPGVTEVNIFALFGGAQIIVPPELAVEVSGSAVFGGFAHLERTSGTPDPDRPLLRVTGFAMMGGVAVETRIPGENERDAHRRRRRERKLKAQAAKKALPPADR
jgi:hypothetical protein